MSGKGSPENETLRGDQVKIEAVTVQPRGKPGGRSGEWAHGLCGCTSHCGTCKFAFGRGSLEHYSADRIGLPKQEGKVLQNLRRQCFLKVSSYYVPMNSTFPVGVNFSQGSQFFPRDLTFPMESSFPKGLNFSRGSQFFPRESTFPEGVNFSRGSQLFPRESTFPLGVNLSRGSQLFPRESTFSEGFNFSRGT